MDGVTPPHRGRWLGANGSDCRGRRGALRGRRLAETGVVAVVATCGLLPRPPAARSDVEAAWTARRRDSGLSPCRPPRAALGPVAAVAGFFPGRILPRCRRRQLLRRPRRVLPRGARGEERFRALAANTTAPAMISECPCAATAMGLLSRCARGAPRAPPADSSRRARRGARRNAGQRGAAAAAAAPPCHKRRAQTHTCICSRPDALTWSPRLRPQRRRARPEGAGGPRRSWAADVVRHRRRRSLLVHVQAFNGWGASNTALRLAASLGGEGERSTRFSAHSG